VIELPDPPLRSGDLLMRPWQVADAPALVAAWADPEIQRWTAVPPVRDLTHAERWIAGQDLRRARDLSLDLVIDLGGAVAGEVGLSSLDRVDGTVAMGWWVAAGHRGHGVATTAVVLVAGWCRTVLALGPVAEIQPQNLASIAVARAAGLVR
jgi:[ribosomal protein S5]-alanine N-acetyltransferase